MKVSFFWIFSQDEKYPDCCTDIISEDGVDILACLLNDDGGQGYKNSIEWIDYGISKINKVIGNELKDFSWDRDSWGVNLRDDMAVIYSLLDDEYFVTMKINDFYDVLLRWRDFLNEDGENSVVVQK
ncbi:Protein involved in mRNA turnover and stability [Comamonas testosteroni TK102]|uniref:Protein involved in mRNA turnover and stability n=1 Tax=Comamonas testosteroni TK102 TaxID=1392005 RepID=A0A076PTD0_COMTE|nr:MULTISPECIES: hypothetical protein [Comamonas]AIJ46587.1 Protein involved in mRNA turnover and stability [Comamonas testosteroni TK102]MPS89768.1 hypothetical protein [Comamonas sp.]